MNTGFCAPSIPFRSIHRLIQSVLPQLTFSFYRHQPIRTDFSGGQITCAGRASEVFAFYNDRGECENRIEEFKNGFRADRLSCHRFLANAFRYSCTPPLTTWLTSFVCSCPSLGAPPKSKPWSGSISSQLPVPRFRSPGFQSLNSLSDRRPNAVRCHRSD